MESQPSSFLSVSFLEDLFGYICDYMVSSITTRVLKIASIARIRGFYARELAFPLVTSLLMYSKCCTAVP